jgi:hypothetical protein
MTWENILKAREGYSEEDLERITPDWEELLGDIEKEEPEEFNALDKERPKKKQSYMTQFGGGKKDAPILVYKDTWHKYTNDKNWIKSLDYKPDFKKQPKYKPKKNPELRALDRTPPKMIDGAGSFYDYANRG